VQSPGLEQGLSASALGFHTAGLLRWLHWAGRTSAMGSAEHRACSALAPSALGDAPALEDTDQNTPDESADREKEKKEETVSPG